MKFITNLAPEAVASLEQVWRGGASHRERERAHAVLLSAKGFSLNTLSQIFGIDRDSISLWLDRYQEQGLEGLKDLPKSGRPSKLREEDRAIIEEVLEHPRADLKPFLMGRLKKGGLREASGRHPSGRHRSLLVHGETVLQENRRHLSPRPPCSSPASEPTTGTEGAKSDREGADSG